MVIKICDVSLQLRKACLKVIGFACRCEFKRLLAAHGLIDIVSGTDNHEAQFLDSIWVCAPCEGWNLNRAVQPAHNVVVTVVLKTSPRRLLEARMAYHMKKLLMQLSMRSHLWLIHQAASLV